MNTYPIFLCQSLLYLSILIKLSLCLKISSYPKISLIEIQTTIYNRKFYCYNMSRYFSLQKSTEKKNIKWFCTFDFLSSSTFHRTKGEVQILSDGVVFILIHDLQVRQTIFQMLSDKLAWAELFCATLF